MQEEIPERMKGLCRERVRDREGAAVDLRSCGHGGQSPDVTSGASNLVEKMGAPLRRGSLRKLCVAGGSLCRSHESSKAIDIGEPIRTRLVIWLGSGIAEFCDFVRKEPIGDAHFIEGGIA